MNDESQARQKILGPLLAFPAMTMVAMGSGLSILGFLAVGASFLGVVITHRNYTKLHGQARRLQDQAPPSEGEDAIDE